MALLILGCEEWGLFLSDFFWTYDLSAWLARFIAL
jgi:hypothetical protein